MTIPSDKPDLTLRGSTGSPADVVITAANDNGEPDPAGGTYGTEGSATVHAQASGFTAGYITFAKTFDKNDFPTVTGAQAVAVAMEGDRQVYRDDMAPNDIYLGRAWEPYTGAVPQLVVRDTNLPAQVNAAGPDLGISGATWTAGRYGEYGNTGYGASPAYPLGLTLRGVHFDVTATTAQDADITEAGSNLAISGPGVTVTPGR